MSSPFPILVCSAGRRVELTECFRRAGDALGLSIVVHAADLVPSASAACLVADARHEVPRADSDGYADAVLALARQQGVRLVVPTIDTELAALAAARPRFEADGIRVAIGSPALVDIARDKLKTATFLAERGVSVPRTASLEAALQDPSAWQGRLFLKPRHGSSGRGIRAVDDISALARERFTEPMLVQERLQGPEFTVNCFFDRGGTLRAAVPHERLAVRGGEVEKGITRREPELAELARRLADALPGPEAALCFQAMRSEDGRFCLFEINARFGGGYPLAHEAGAPFARWLLEECAGAPSTAGDGWADGVLMVRHDRSLFVRQGPTA
jgi:carbamoyl-phosphate synthase large subunit